MANLYTKTGDKGQTSLVGGLRVSKASQRVDCYGTIDEANSMMGLAYAQTSLDFVRTSLHTIQGRLFALGAELASDHETAETLKGRIQETDIAFLESVVDKCTETTGKQTHFVIPGVDPASAALHVARTIVRRAERNMVQLAETEPLRELLLRYVNRLSDATYAMARLQEDTTKQEQMREKVTQLVRSALASAQPAEKPLNLARAQEMAKRAEVKAKEMGVPIVFAVADSGGNPILLQRMEGALLVSVDVAQAKAYTASAVKVPTHVLAEVAGSNGPLFGIDNATPGKIIIFGGGFPYECGGEVVGGIGVSGGSVEEDMEIARYAMGG